MPSNSIALRLQQMSHNETTLVLGHLAGARNGSGYFAPRDISALADSLALPRPASQSSVLAELQRQELVVRQPGRSTPWRLTPAGIEDVKDLVPDADVIGLVAVLGEIGYSLLGTVEHPLLPPELAPPEILSHIRRFLSEHPFDTNTFAITRFPTNQPSDPIMTALEACKAACEIAGLELHLAADRMIVDDLWANVTAHMWSSRYAIAIFEDRLGTGLNHNVSIETGAMLMSGRRCALLKDSSVDRMPTDLVGRIYKSVELDSQSEVYDTVLEWIRSDLRIGAAS